MHTIKSSNHISNFDEHNNQLSSVLIPLDSNDGFVFGLIRFLGKNGQTQSRLAEIIEERLSRFKETINDGVNTARRFEQLLQALNQDVAQIIHEERQFPLSDAHVIIGVIHGSQIFLSGTGNLTALFMHKSAKQRYVLYELSEQLKNKEDSSWEKVFSTVLDGELHQGDIFYIATHVSAREITAGELQDILTTLPASGSLKRISQFLHSDTVYGAICFQVAEETIYGAPKKVNPTHSMNHLDETKKDASHYLGEQVPNVGEFISKITTPIIKKLSAPGTRGYKSLLKRATKISLQLITLALVGIIKIIAFIFKYLVLCIRNLPFIFKKGSNFIKEQPHPKERLNRGITWFNSLPALSKYGGLALIVIVSVFSSILILTHQSQVRQEQSDTFNTIVSNIEEKISASQASLIYDDNAQAKTHLQEAMTLLQTLPSNSGAQEKTITDLEGKLQSLSYEIQKITPVELTVMAQNTQLQLSQGVQVAGSIYGISGKNIYRLNELEGQWQFIQTQSGSISDIKIASIAEENAFLFTDASKQLGRADLDSLTLNPIVSGSNETKSIEDLQFYNNNLYILSASGDQIIKMRPRGDGYEAGTPWITSTMSGTTLTNARAITIDGNIYILTDSTVLSFLSGRQQTFDMEVISPKMHNPIDIVTTDDGNYIYILEPEENRIIVLDKQGKLIAQYINDEIANAKSIFIKNTSVIIVTDTTAYSFGANHLLQ